MAIEAAVEAIEKNGYRLVVPIEFSVTRVAATAKDHAESQPVSYGAHRPQSTFDPGTSASAMNEAPEKPTTSGTAGNTERKKKP